MTRYQTGSGRFHWWRPGSGGWYGAGVWGLPPVELGVGWDSIPVSGGVAAWRHGSRKSAVAAYSQ